MMRLRKRTTTKLNKKGITTRFSGLDSWPDDVVGWLRIPSMIMFIIGILGILKYTWPEASRVLKINLPRLEFCWMMLIAGGTVYLMSVICWLCFENVRKTCRPGDNDTASPGRWRSL